MKIFKDDYSTSVGSGETFDFVIKQTSKQFESYYNESLKSAEEIWNNKTGNLYIMYSGGLDSEFTLNTFLNLGMNVIPVIIKMLPYYNLHDIKYAFKFCKEKNLSPLVIDFDFDHFVTSGRMFDVANEFNCPIFQRTVLLDTIPKLNGTIIAGHEEPYLELDMETKIWNFILNEHDVRPFEILYEKYSIIGTPFFLRYSFEQFASFMKNHYLQELVTKTTYIYNSSFYKINIYNSDNNFNLKNRPKFHGYEVISKSKIFQHSSFKEIEKLKEKYNGYFKKSYDNMLTYLDIN